jgi:hypothetical protein
MKAGLIIPSGGLDPLTSGVPGQEVSSLEHSIKIKRFIVNVAVALNTAHQLSNYVLSQTADDVNAHTSKSQGLVAAIYARYLELSDSMASQVKIMRANGTLNSGSNFADGMNGAVSKSAHQLIILPEHFSRKQLRQKFSKCIKCRGPAFDDRLKTAINRSKREPERRCECSDVVDNGDKTITLPSSPWEGSLYKLTLLVSLRAKILLKSIFAAFVQNASMAKFRREAVIACCKMRLELLMKRCFQSILFESLSTKYIALSAYQRAYTMIKRRFLKPAYLTLKAHCAALQLFSTNYEISGRHRLTSQMRSGFNNFLGNKNYRKNLTRRRSCASIIATEMAKRSAFQAWTAAFDRKKSVKVMLSDRFSSLTPTVKHAARSGIRRQESETGLEDTHVHVPPSRRVSFADDLSETLSSSSSSRSSRSSSTNTTRRNENHQPATTLKASSALALSESPRINHQSEQHSREQLFSADQTVSVAGCDTAFSGTVTDQCQTQGQRDALTFTQATQTIAPRKASFSTIEDFLAASAGTIQSPDNYFKSIFECAGVTRGSDLCRSTEGSEHDSEVREASPEPLPAPIPVPASATVVKALPAASISAVSDPHDDHTAALQRERSSRTSEEGSYGGKESDSTQSLPEPGIIDRSRSVRQGATSVKVRTVLPSDKRIDLKDQVVEPNYLLNTVTATERQERTTRKTGTALRVVTAAAGVTSEAVASSSAAAAAATTLTPPLAAHMPPDIENTRQSRELDVYRGLLLSYERVFDELRLGAGYRQTVDPRSSQLEIPGGMTSEMAMTIRDSWRDLGPLIPRGELLPTVDPGYRPRDDGDMLPLFDIDASTRSYDSDSIEEPSAMRVRERARVSRRAQSPPTEQYRGISQDDELDSSPGTAVNEGYWADAVDEEPADLSITLDGARQVRTVTLVQTQSQTQTLQSVRSGQYSTDSSSDRLSPSWALEQDLKAATTARSHPIPTSTITQNYYDFSRQESEWGDDMYEGLSDRNLVGDKAVPFALVEAQGPQDTASLMETRKEPAYIESIAAAQSVKTATTELDAHIGATGIEECDSETTSVPDEEQVREQCEIYDDVRGDAAEAPSRRLRHLVQSSASVLQEEKSLKGRRRKSRRNDRSPVRGTAGHGGLLGASNDDTQDDSSAESTDEGDSISSSLGHLPVPMDTDIPSRSLSVKAQPSPAGAGLPPIESAAQDAAVASAGRHSDTLDNLRQSSEEGSQSTVSDTDQIALVTPPDSTTPSRSPKQRKVELESSSRFLPMFSVTDGTTANEGDSSAREGPSTGLTQLSLALKANRPRPRPSSYSGTQIHAVTENVIEYEDDTVTMDAAILLRRCLRCFRKLRSLARISRAYRRIRRSHR